MGVGVWGFIVRVSICRCVPIGLGWDGEIVGGLCFASRRVMYTTLRQKCIRRQDER